MIPVFESMLKDCGQTGEMGTLLILVAEISWKVIYPSVISPPPVEMGVNCIVADASLVKLYK